MALQKRFKWYNWQCILISRIHLCAWPRRQPGQSPAITRTTPSQSRVQKCMVSTYTSYSEGTWFECGAKGCSRFCIEVLSIGRSRWCPDIVSHHHHHHIPVTDLSHLSTRSGLTCQEVSSQVCHDSFCHSGNSVSLPWVIYYEAFCLHVVFSFSCIPVICPNLELCVW
jgi:hypothetical protein